MTCPQPTADTNRVSLYISPEPDDCWGADPGVGALAPKAYELKMTGETLVHNKQTTVSNVIRTDRMRDTLSEVGVSTEGDINFELTFRDLDLMLQGALANNFTYLIERSIPAGAVNAVSATNRFVVTSGGTDFDNFVAGADVWVSNFEDFAKNNGRFLISALGAGGSYLQVNPEATGVTLGDETPTSGVALVFKTPKGVFTDLEITGANTMTSVTTNFLTGLNLSVGQNIRIDGSSVAGNNKVVKIASIAAHLLTFTNAGLTAATPGDTIILTAARLKNGIARKSFLVEKKFGDVLKFIHMTGMRVGQMSLNVESQALVTGTFSMQGKEGLGTDTSVLGTIIPAGIKDALNATTNVGQIEEGGIALSTAVRSIALTVNNNLRTKPQIGSRSPVDIGYGFVDVTGTLTAYFEDLLMFNKFVNHTSSQLAFRFTDSETNVLVFTLPRLYFSSGTPQAPQGNDDVMQPMEFTAVRSNDDDAVIMIDALPGPIV